MDTIEYWKRQWNFISDTKNVANNSDAIEQEQRRGIYYYDTKGKLVRREESEEYRNYIIMKPVDEKYSEVYYVTIPNKEAIKKIKSIRDEKSIYERGIAIATDGSCSDIAYGSKDKISKEQWGKVLDKFLRDGKTIAYLIHSHPLNVVGSRVEIKETVPEEEIYGPSDTDLGTKFYEDKVGAIIWWKNVFNKPEKGYSHNRLDYRARISFYRQFEKLNGSLLELNTSIDDFADDFAKKW